MRQLLVGITVSAVWNMWLWPHYAANHEIDSLVVAVVQLISYSVFWALFCLGASRAARRFLGREAGLVFALGWTPLAAVVLLVTLHWLSLDAVGLAFVSAGWTLSFWWMWRRAPGRTPLGVRFLGGAAGIAVGLALAGPVATYVAADPSGVLLPQVNLAEERVHLVGFDGLDLAVLNALVERGQLPAFAELLDSGVLVEVTPLSGSSPLLWTSYATGRVPEDHGVDDFDSKNLLGWRPRLPNTETDFLFFGLDLVWPTIRDQVPIDSRAWRVPALWELVTQLGGSAVVVNWWATYPAADSGAVVVTPQAFPARARDVTAFDVSSPEEHEIVPAEIAAAVHQRIVDIMSGPPMDRRAQLHSAIGQAALTLRSELCSPSASLCAAVDGSIDLASHEYSFRVFGLPEGPIVSPLTPRLEAAEAEALFETLVVQAYVAVDARLGFLLDSLRENDQLVVVSDHGWRYDGTEHRQRRLNGMVEPWPSAAFFFYGNAFARPDMPIRGRTVDLFPTVAALLGVPASEQLPGNALPIFRQGYPAPPATIPTYGRRDVTIGVSGAQNDARLQELRALGYIQ